MSSYSDEEILNEIRRVADLPAVDRVPSRRAFDDHAELSSSTVARRFGSWGAAVEQAGLAPNSPPDKIPRDELTAELRRLRDELDQIPTADQMDEHGARVHQPTTSDSGRGQTRSKGSSVNCFGVKPRGFRVDSRSNR